MARFQIVVSPAKLMKLNPSISRYLKAICKCNPSNIVKALIAFLLCFLLLFTLFVIINGSPSNGLLSSLLDYQLHNEASKNISKQDYMGGEDFNISQPIAEKGYDKLLGGLLPAGFDESSCLSRYQLNLYRKTQPRQPSPHFISRLRNYESLHKQCGPYTDAYNKTLEILKSGSRKTNASGCKYVIWTPLAGLGNRIVTLGSAFLYALLTNRVLLIVQEGNIQDLFCEPFPEFSWLLPSDFPIGKFYKLDQFCPFNYWNMVKNHSIRKSRVPPAVYIHLVHDYRDEYKIFFCDKDQKLLQNVPWLIVKSDQYFAPALFLIPSFQQELHNLFPEKETVFHHLGRYLFHPTNSVWGLVKRYYEAYLAEADEKLGFQIRVFLDRGNVSPKDFLEQILDCTLKENLLPKVNKKEPIIKKFENQTRKVVLVTSLTSDYYEKLQNMYWEYATITGEVIAFLQPSHEEIQQTENQMHDRKALAEIYLLSMTDELVTTAWSTFGYVAQSLGGLRPWILYQPQGRKASDPPCLRGSSMEPCFHFAPSSLSCRKGEGKETSNIVPHVRHCEDVTMGLKLFDTHF